MPTRHYHVPREPSYTGTIPGVCFQNAAAADAAGFSPAGDAAGLPDATVTRERAALARKDTVAVAEEANTIGVAKERTGADVAAAVAGDVGGVPPGAIRGDGGRDCPPAYPIKAHEKSRVYHQPGTPAYSTLVPQLCFSSAESARAAGFTPARDA
jgi:hypothetical protein